MHSLALGCASFSGLVPTNALVAINSRIVSNPEIGKDEAFLISPFDVLGEQLRWFAYCAEQLLDRVPV